MCEHHEFLGKLIEGAEKLQAVETLRKGPSGKTLQANYEHLKTPISAYAFSCRAGHQSFNRQALLSQSDCRLDLSEPMCPSHRELWESLARALQAPSQGFVDAAPFSSRVALDRLFL